MVVQRTPNAPTVHFNPNPCINESYTVRRGYFATAFASKTVYCFFAKTQHYGFLEEVILTRAILRALAALAIVLAFGLVPAAAQTGQMFGELV